MPRPLPVPTEVLDRLLERSGADSFELPPLVIPKEESPGWVQRFLHWLSSLFPDPGPGKAGDWFPALLKAIAVFGAIMIVVAIVSMVYNAVKRARLQAQDAKYGAKGAGAELPPREKLQALVEDALRAGRTSEAARLRWKLYLVRKALPGSVTPGETESFGRYYPLMFGASAGETALGQFNDLDQSLRALEKAPQA